MRLKRTKLFIIIITLCPALSIALSSPYIKHFSEQFVINFSFQTFDNGVLIAGDYGIGTVSPALIKYSEDSKVQWAYQYKLPDRYYGTVKKVYQLSDDGFLAIGEITFPGFLERHALIIRVNSKGKLIWQRWIAGTASDLIYDCAVTDSNYLCVGTTQSYARQGFSDGWLLIISPSGNVRSYFTYGGTDADDLFSIQPAQNNNFLIAGHKDGFSEGRSKAFLLKIRQDGKLIWNRQYMATEEGWVDVASMSKSNNGYVVAGGYSQSIEPEDILVFKVNENGQLLWKKTFGKQQFDSAHNVLAMNDGGVLVTGTTDSFKNGQGFLIKLTSAGKTVWSSLFGGESADSLDSSSVSSDGKIYLAGLHYTLDGGPYIYYSAVLDETGRFRGCELVTRAVLPSRIPFLKVIQGEINAFVGTLTGQTIQMNRQTIRVTAKSLCTP